MSVIERNVRKVVYSANAYNVCMRVSVYAFQADIQFQYIEEGTADGHR